MNRESLLYHYFSNSLTKAQEEQLQELLRTDVEFAIQFEFESNLKRVAKEKRHHDLKSKLNRFEAETVSEDILRKPNFSYLKIAASILILIAAGWFGYHNFSGTDYSNLYAENYNTYPNTVYTITRSDTINSLEREAFVAYEVEDYELALEKFKTLESKDDFNFYRAQSYLKLNKEEEAKLLFEKVILQNNRFVAESHWYMALIYIKEKDKDMALGYLDDLVTNYNYKKTDANKLIEKLR